MTDQPARSMARAPKPAGLRISGVTFAHCALLARLHGLCFEEAWNSATVAQVLRLTGAFGLLATLPERSDPLFPGSDDRAPAGFALVAGALDERELLSLGVPLQHRRRGIATALIEGVIDRVRAEGVVRLFLEVAEDNDDARRLYASFGFEQIGRRPGYYTRREGPSVPALTLALKLA
ncbi:MAG: GNAT family N-acetyltransferase [Gemmatimonas sp.]